VSNEITGLVGLQTKNLACTGQQLIPGLTTDVRGAYCWTVAVRPGIRQRAAAAVHRDSGVGRSNYPLNLSPRAQARGVGGGWARRAQAEKKIKKDLTGLRLCGNYGKF